MMKFSKRSNSGASISSHLKFVGLAMLVLMVVQSLLRLALLVYNREQLGGTTAAMLAEAFFNGIRFDLRLSVFVCLPLLLLLPSLRAMAARGPMRLWLVAVSGIVVFLGVVELDFYREFNQRLNGLVFQYMKEDPKTVLSMIWYGFPVVRHLLVCALAIWLLVLLYRAIDHATRPARTVGRQPLALRLIVLFVGVVLTVVAARGTLRQGPPLRWGDAFTTDSTFANQLGLNGTLSLVNAARVLFDSHRDNVWKTSLSDEEALATVRGMLLTAHDQLVDKDEAAVRRDFTPPAAGVLPIRNVVLILMESFAGRHVGALGDQGGITPYFDKLAGEGVLFRRIFSNGTHTHQGMFATIGCFPNLPAFEYLMQTPESSNDFSGLPQLLSARKLDNLYVYNGDFGWDNQSGFFGRQGVTNFIGRHDFKNPVVFDPTWGVSDQDMFDRAAEELAKRKGDQPFYAILQTLSNHTPYALPNPLPMPPVTGHGSSDAHLTAMRYSDWALGQFFAKVKKEPFYKETLFIVVGDHGFADGEQLTEMNLARFNVPLLMIAPGMRERFGPTVDTVGTQVDIVPTAMGRLGGKVRHQCWGRDLLSLPKEDLGVAVIKPSGNDQTVAIASGDRLFVESRSKATSYYQYRLWTDPFAKELPNDEQSAALRRKLDAYIAVATRSLLDNTTGVAGRPAIRRAK